MRQETYTTTDIYLASTLVAMGWFVMKIDKTDPKRAIFVFEGTDDIRKDVTFYWNEQLEISPRELFNSFKELKTRLYNEQP